MGDKSKLKAVGLATGRLVRWGLAIWGTTYLVAALRPRPCAAEIQRAWNWYSGLWDGALTWTTAGAALAVLAAFASSVVARLLRAPQRLAHLLLLIAAVLVAVAIVSYALGREASEVALLSVFGAACWATARHRVRPRGPARALDEPITSKASDSFERSSLVDQVEALLTVPAPLHCPKVAICGPVGHGKTSVANLVRERLHAKGYVSLRFEAWHYRSSDEATKALRLTIDEALAQLPGFGGLGPLRQLAGAAGASVQSRWASLLADPVEQHLRLSKAELSSLLARKLPAGKRVVVFIDDVERAEAAVARDLLMQAHELVTAAGLAYVFLFDRKLLLRRARSRQNGFDASLLEKVFDRVFELPAPTTRQLRHYDDSLFKDLKLQADLCAAWREIDGAVPSSPRRRSRFALHAMSSSRLREGVQGPFSLEVLMLLELFEFTKPGAITWLRSSGDWQEELAYAPIRGSIAGKDERPPPPLPEWWRHGSDYDRVFEELKGRVGLSLTAFFERREEAVPLALHLAWLNGDDIPRELAIARTLSTVRDPSSLSDAMNKLSDENSEALHTALILTAGSFYSEMVHASIPRLEEIRVTLEGIRRERGRLISQQPRFAFTSNGALSKAMEQLYFYNRMRGEHDHHRPYDIELLKRMLDKVGSDLPAFFDEVKHRSMVAPRGVPDMVAYAYDLMSAAFLRDFGSGTLRNLLDHEDARVWRLSALFRGDPVDQELIHAITQRLGDATSPEGTIEDALALVQALADELGQCPGLSKETTFLGTLWGCAVRAPFTAARAWQMEHAAAEFRQRCDPVGEEFMRLPADWRARLASWNG